jgi:3D (Asp-Asp-Asp) domain-containing protein
MGISLCQAVLRIACLLTFAVSLASSSPASECAARTMRVTFYTCAEGSPRCLTSRGHQPMPFRTVAVGDRALLGRWLYVEDLGGWVLAADTGAALKKDAMDVFMGEQRMAAYAKRLGVQYWSIGVCALAGAHTPAELREARADAPPAPSSAGTP